MNDYPTRIGYTQALQIVAAVAHARRLSTEHRSLQRAEGHVLAHNLLAPIDLPAFDNSRMDGFALRHADLAAHAGSGLHIIGQQYAGPLSAPALQAGQCIRITTGAPLPAGCDTVVIKEDVCEHEGMLVVPNPVLAGADIRRQGEDVRAGELVLSAGQVLGPAQVSLAAALGVSQLEVTRRPTVAVFTTGDELVEPGLALVPGQVYNSNRELLMGLLRKEGLEPVAWPTLPDDPALIETALRDAAAVFDVVIACGGVSVGDKDHLPALLETHGRTHFWKVRMKPGMPVLFAEMDRAVLLCLPGNPVSVLATFLTLGRALLDGMQGRAVPQVRRIARLAGPWRKPHERLELLRGQLQHGEDAVLCVMPHAADASHRLHAAAQCDALIVLPEGLRDYAAGELVEVIAY